VRSTPARPAATPPRAVAGFLLAGLVVLAAVGGVLAVAQQHSAVTEAIRDARTLTVLQARELVEPALTDAALAPGPAQEQLDRVVREHVLGEQVVRVKIWSADGRIAYSDDTPLIGRRFDLADEERGALAPGRPAVAEVSDLDEAENADERQFGKLLQVYLGVQTPQGTPLLFETYHRYDRIDAASRQLWLTFLPVLLGGLALLWFAQAPLAWRLATGLRAAHEDREQLLLAALAAADRERARLAADLHDGVVQSLSGASYALSAQAARASTRGDTGTHDALEGVAVELRRSVRELRSLAVTITPPALRRQALPLSVRDLVAPLSDAGLEVALEMDDDVEGSLDDERTDLLLRTLQEAVRNVLRHARARSVRVTLDVDEQRARLRVGDDGVGFTPGSARPDSLGLTLLRGLAEQTGGRLEVTSGAGSGTTLQLTVPVSTRTSLTVPVQGVRA
jgi:signal transduction histidine kinase